MAGAPTRRSRPGDPVTAPPHRGAVALWAFALVASITVLVTPSASAAAPEVLLGRPRVGEYQPVQGGTFLAWQQNTRRSPGHYDVYARPLEGGGRFKVNAAGTQGANGDIAGDVLVYQQFKGGASDLKFFDLVDRDRSAPPAGVNTDQWEYWPSMSDEWLLLARLYGNGVRRIFLFDLGTGNSRRLDEVRGANAFLAPGQVSGDYAVWTRCRSTRCDVIRYHIPDGSEEQIPNDATRQYAASVTSDGTVFLARSRADCGESVRLVRHPLVGDETILWRLPSGDDVGSTKTHMHQQGVTTLLFDHFDCGRASDSDAWRMVEDFAPELTVTVEGDGEGDVTSSPPGIDCGSDCTESFDAGTGVTLTADPDGRAEFAGWSGACTGTNETCTLTMDGPKSVTATFTDNPLLEVDKTGNGNGTVTSSPSGISCGSDCEQAYDQGTSVTLTADPNQNSVFDGWSGACGGSDLTCTVEMNGNRSVTAEFSLEPEDLDVSTTGDGVGTVTGSGIDCPGDCTQSYPSGTEVTLTAQAGQGSDYAGWSGDCSGTDVSCTLTLNGPRTASAAFDDPLLAVGSGRSRRSGMLARRLP